MAARTASRTTVLSSSNSWGVHVNECFDIIGSDDDDNVEEDVAAEEEDEVGVEESKRSK